MKPFADINQNRLRNRIVISAALVAAGICFVNPALAQRTRQNKTLGADNFEGQAAQAGDNIKHIADTIMTDYVSKAVPLMPQDMQSINDVMKDASRYKAKFEKPMKAYLFLIEAYLAHYSGNGDQAIDLIRKALQQDDTISDVTDSAIILGLCHADYILAKSTLKQRNSGEDVTLVPRSEMDRAGDSIAHAQEGMGTGAGQSPVAGQPTKWSMGSPQSGREQPEHTQPGRSSNERERGGSSRSRSSAYRGGQKGVLNLPVECMPFDDLGSKLASLNLKNIDGSFFYFESGKGQILCALLWTLPFQDNADTSSRESSRSRSASRTTSRYGSGGSSSDDSKMLTVAYDLDGNLEQFRQLMLANTMHGRMRFITTNLDAVNQYNWYRIVSTFTENPWPWVNCMAYDPVNAPQWPIENRYSPVMLIVDTSSTIRYIGPVGGFLPQMLINMELPKATPVQVINPPRPPRGQSSGGGGILEWLTGKNAHAAGQASSGTANQTTAPSATTMPTTAKTDEKLSDPQAKSMLKVVYVKKKISPRSAMIQCDEILERFPDTLEADEAKLIITSILRSNSDWVEERKNQGKYTGE